MKIFLTALLTSVFLCGLLTACGNNSNELQGDDSDEPIVSGDEAQQERDSTEQPVYGGRLVQGVIGDATNFIYPLATDKTSHDIAELLYVAPLKYDKNLKIVPWAAERYEVLENGKILRFKLKEGILWDDGVELTSADVEFTYKLMINPKTPTAYAEDFLLVKEFKVIDRYSFEVHYGTPLARSLVTWMHGILPKHVLENQNLLKTKFSRKPLSSGPYRLKEWSAGRRIVLSAREAYFEGRPYIDKIVYRVIPDLSTMFLELKAGHLDMMGLSPVQYLYQTNGPKWDKAFRKFKFLSFSYLFMGYNLKDPKFSDVRVRQALAYAINKKDVVKGAYLGLGMAVVGPYKPGTWVYNEELGDYEYDPETARQLLEDSGWKDTDGDGVLDKAGKPFEFTLMTNQGNTQRIKVATIIQSNLRKIGIKVTIRTVEWAAFIKEFIDKKRFEAVVLGWNILQDPDIYDVWHSSKTAPGMLNFIGYTNEEVDALLERGRTTVNQDDRKRIYYRLQEILHRDQPYCFLAVPYALPIVQARFRGIELAPQGIAYNLTRWWVPKNLQK